MKSNGVIDSIIDDEISNGTFPGIVILVKKRGRIVFNEAKGERQIYPDSKEMGLDTFFDLASLTKPLATAITALSIFEKERISPLLTVGRFIPELSTKTADVTLHQLFTHTSGLPSVPEIFKLFSGENDIDQEKALNYLFSLTPVVKAGTQVIYSCTGYIILTQILKKITGKDLPELFTEFVTAPGSITGLMFNPLPKKDNFASTEFCSWRKRWLIGEVHDENSFCLKGAGGNAGLFGNASSITELLSLFRNDGILNDHRILSKESIRLMTSNQTPGLSPKRTYGFLTQDNNSFAGAGFSSSAYGHTGFTGTSVWIDPEIELEAVILTNRVHMGRDTNSDKIINFRKKIHAAILREFF